MRHGDLVSIILWHALWFTKWFLCHPFAVFVNRDQLTGFGTPWEIRFQANYTVLRKGGNVAGYSAFHSYVPDLNLGMWGMFVLCFDRKVCGINVLQDSMCCGLVALMSLLRPTVLMTLSFLLLWSTSWVFNHCTPTHLIQRCRIALHNHPLWWYFKWWRKVERMFPPCLNNILA